MISTSQDQFPHLTTVKIGAGYRLEEEISRGSTASIYRAVEPGNEQPVAIKVFHARYHADPRFAIRFREHLRHLARLSHDNLVSVLDYGVDQNQYYIVMEWIDGADLGTYIADYGALPSDLAIILARQVCAALNAIHEHGLVHQGIRPRNILLTAEGKIKVTDVGLSGLLSESGLSKTHVMLAGVRYISPEQARGKRITLQSDIYSLGATLFEMLTSRLPFESSDAWSVLRMHAREKPPSPRQFNQQVSEELANIVMRALQKEPELRFPSAVEMDAALSALQEDFDLTPFDTPYSNGRSVEIGLASMLKDLLELNTVKNLLMSPWQIAGQTLPFGVILAFLFILAFLIAFAIVYIMVGLS